VSSPWIQFNDLKAGDVVRFKEDKIPDRFERFFQEGHDNKFTVVRVYSYNKKGQQLLSFRSHSGISKSDCSGWYIERFERVI
jgi:hypothetical protein